MRTWRSAAPRVNARGYRGKPDRERMNKTEAAYADHLYLRQMGGEILTFGFQRIKLRLANLTWYEPDFDLQLEDGTIEVHEVKGFWDDDARNKVKIAADLYPFRFVGVMLLTRRQAIERQNGHGWELEYFAPATPPADLPRPVVFPPDNANPPANPSTARPAPVVERQ